MDGDAFFTSVEQALKPELRGRPVVTGQERGIIACASYEAKALGIARGIMLSEARKICPALVILPSDYETYSLFSNRMFSIIRRFTPDVEEYSIDEAFADITGMRRVFRCSYEEIARKIQVDVEKELGLTVSVGLSLSKSLAKLCSKFRKPKGFTAVPGRVIHVLLQRTPLDKVWGFGPNTVSLLQKNGLRTAYDFVIRPEDWASKLLGKRGLEMRAELRGHCMWKVEPEAKSTYASIMKSKTFTPPSTDRALVFAELVRNMEGALAKARRFELRPKMIGVVLRRQNFLHDGLECRLSRPSAASQEVLPLVRTLFDQVFSEGVPYRASLIYLGLLEGDRQRQYELFDDPIRLENLRQLNRAVDEINDRYGRATVGSGALLFRRNKPVVARDARPDRAKVILAGETAKRRLAIPYVAIKV